MCRKQPRAFVRLVPESLHHMGKLAWMTIVLLAATAGPATAGTIVFNSDTGVVEVNGTPVTSLNGTPFTTALDPSTGIRRWFFAGDLNIGSADKVSGLGAYGISLMAGNNATIAPGATFNVSALGNSAGSGGGIGGTSGMSNNGGAGGGGGGGWWGWLGPVERLGRLVW